MDINIRNHIINNFKGDDFDTLRKAIEESIKDNDEVVLPGMGVFFELVWTDCSEDMKKEIINIIKERVNKNPE